MTELLRRYGAIGVALTGLGLLVLGPALALSGKQKGAEPAVAVEAVQTESGERIQTVPKVSSKAASTKGASSNSASTTWVKSEPQNRACFKTRRKLWQDGEGWIVKNTTVCP